jgi:hypothetical protein
MKPNKRQKEILEKVRQGATLGELLSEYHTFDIVILSRAGYLRIRPDRKTEIGEVTQ